MLHKPMTRQLIIELTYFLIAGLYELWKTGRYKSYPPSVLIDLVARILALVPPWTRVYRVQRDIPMPLVSSGVSILKLLFQVLIITCLEEMKYFYQ